MLSVSITQHRYKVVKNMNEIIIEIVTAYQVSQPDSLVVVIPKRVREILRINKGKRFFVKVDKDGRIIYELIEKEPEK